MVDPAGCLCTGWEETVSGKALIPLELHLLHLTVSPARSAGIAQSEITLTEKAQ